MQDLDPLWVAEFCGLFWGEGSINMQVKDLVYYVDGEERPSFRVTFKFSIGLRADNLPILRDIKDKLGGHIYKREGGRHYVWVVSKLSLIKKIAALLMSGQMPSSKKDELLWLEKAIQFRETRPRKGANRKVFQAGDKEKFLEFKRNLERCRKF